MKENKTLVEIQKMDQNIPVDAFCSGTYSSNGYSTSCSMSYSCSSMSVSSTLEDDDLLL